MEFRIRIPSLRALLPIVIVLAAVGGFMAADRLALHWYVPEDSSGEVATLESQVSEARSDIALFAGAIDRLGTVVTINSLASNLGGFQQLDSPAAIACRDWLLFGEGEITECGFTVES